MMGKALSRGSSLENGLQVKPILPQSPTEEEKDGRLAVPGGQPRVYKRRWIMVFLFCFYSLSNAYQWIHLNIIANVIIKYYNQSLPEDTFKRETTVDWLSMIYMLAYIPLIFPSTFLLNKKGLRVVAICGSFLNALGSCLKLACVSPDRFPVLMFAQTICAIAQIFILGLPARIAAVWFGPNEVSTATSLGVFGNQVGVAVGFLVPPLIVRNSDDLDEIGNDLWAMFIGTAVVTGSLFLLVILVFRERPLTPPSKAQMIAVENEANEHYGKSLLNLFKNRGFMILTITYGINTGCYYGISTLLNPVVLHYFPGEEENAGLIGLTIVLAGVAGSIVAGIWLDKTKTFKATTLGIYFLSLAGMIAFTFTLDLSLMWVVFVCGGSLGFFMTGYLPVGFEFAAEITYPESEGTSSGLLNASAQTFGIILTISMRAMLSNVSVLGANLTVSAVLLLGTILTCFIGADYRRQAAGKEIVEELDNIEYEVPAPVKNPEELSKL
ncbi:feline leukemia virus subgroup C receptor-related protein 2-like isoform X1 [Pecten maximus]|uniref:feline leukemia virus subgroup C receptor-related protein 2-like isoform X1 n=1 Tax=Pecten maximus TaxID=6579 RepID=UPI001457EA35|nr:feline leukemia virus subgroup C receptor-related protein 2-like isoform X1 [Pecten maximus]